MEIIFHRLSRARYEINSAASTALQFSIPVATSVAFGCGRLTNVRETVGAALVCAVIAYVR
jgi:hypothetical protein